MKIEAERFGFVQERQVELKELSGVTLESVSIATRTVRALRVRASRGEIDPKDFPILMHIGDVLDGKCKLSMPWKSFQ